MTAPEKAPAERLLEAHMAAAPFRSGLREGVWSLRQLDFPFAVFELSAAERAGAPDSYGLRFTLTEYPSEVTACPWDLQTDHPLATSQWPTGGRLTQIFNPAWRTDALYMPMDRQALEGHDAWRTTHAAYLWDRSKGTSNTCRPSQSCCTATSTRGCVVADAAIRVPRRMWSKLFRELGVRGRGERESGAFLLAGRDDTRSKVCSVVYFDDLDPDCLTGAISLPGRAFGRLWRFCEESRTRVVADVHTHPSTRVGQSPTDAANPMIAQRGHVALIAPNFAQGRVRPEHLGVHRYLGDHEWASAFGDEAAALVRRTWW